MVSVVAKFIMQPFSSLGFFSWTNRVGVANRTIDDTRVRNVEVDTVSSENINGLNMFNYATQQGITGYIIGNGVKAHSNPRTKEIWEMINAK